MQPIMMKGSWGLSAEKAFQQIEKASKLPLEYHPNTHVRIDLLQLQWGMLILRACLSMQSCTLINNVVYAY